MLRVILVICLVKSWLMVSSQCNLVISGQVVDQGTEIPLPFATIFLEETGAGGLTDSTGTFVLNDICPGEYHLRVTHVGCTPQEFFFLLNADTTFHIHLAHHVELLDEVVVHGHHADNTSQSSSTLSRNVIAQESGKNLAEVLESIPGVRALRSGAGIAKPMIHGLFGNRITILNNGIVQAGQQWGNDHAPEIDPFAADHLSVVKGVGALEYGGNALGGVVLVETAPVSADPHLHGEVNYAFASNGRGNTLSGTFEKQGKWAAWRATATLKLHGDTKTPDYFLTNTGQQEGNLALQFEKQWNSQWRTELYYSLFDTEIGILRGSHIGNLTDLEAAIDRDVPFFTQDAFSYRINAPRQEVTHHLLKILNRLLVSDDQVLTLTYGGQLNQRKEFDVRRSGRSDIPALSLDQYAHAFSAKFDQTLANGGLLKVALQFDIEDNTNDPETGIFPLIPDYRQFNTGLFVLLRKEAGDLTSEVGARYDYRWLNVLRITQSVPPAIDRIERNFHNVSVSTGVRWRTTSAWRNALNVGFTSRAPEVNELYSAGLHQGVSGIEEGNEALDTERSLKLTLSSDLNISSRMFLQVLGYYQRIGNYIYLQPDSAFRLTIRGAFPVFTYAQEDATIKGVDVQLKYEPAAQLKFVARYSLVRGDGESLPLVYMPSDHLFASATWLLPDVGKLRSGFLGIDGNFIFAQSRIDPAQDFKEPPGSYFLLGARAGVTIPMSKAHLDLSVHVENALNTAYRDYLNRLRYFADDTGINVRVRVHYHF